MIFCKLPDDIFRPLSGSNRHIFEKVLKHLHSVFGDDENPDTDALSKRLVIEEIHQVLILEGDFTLPDEDSEIVYESPATAAEYIYQRLINCGWLEREEDGYNVNIVPNPHARLLLEALIGIENQEKKSYGRTVLSIYNSLEAAQRDPKEMGSLIFEAISQAREFTNHLRNITYSLREVQEQLAAIKDPRKVLEHFFELFVENILISDYKSLHLSDNPFRFRTKIISLTRSIEFLPASLEPMIALYQEQYNIDVEEAQLRLNRDLRYIRRVFEGVEQRLRKIDTFMGRLQSRVGETVKMIERTMPGMSNRLADLLTVLGQKFADNQLDDDPPSPPRMQSANAISTFSLRAPRGRKEKPAAQVLKPKINDPESKERKRLMREFMKKRAFEPMRVMRYIDSQMKDKTVMVAADFAVESVDDLISFLLIGQLSRMTGVGQLRAKKYVVRKKPGMIETEWITCRDFTIERPLDAFRS